MPQKKGTQQGKRAKSEKDGGILFMRIKVDVLVVDELKGFMYIDKWVPDMWDQVINPQ
ncbi:MAG TPA: hypothetical protein VIZ18_00405 [Ktedonobacteraceae bacterium]